MAFNFIARHSSLKMHRFTLSHIVITSFTAFLCLYSLSYISHSIVGAQAIPVLLASMGAAAVLMIAAPNSPMATPWAFVGGNILSAFVGVVCVQFLPHSLMLGPIAVAAAIACMHICRCQHPPGGATALFAVIGGEQVHSLAYAYVVAPVALNVVLFVVVVSLHRYFLNQQAIKNRQYARLLTVNKPQQLEGASVYTNKEIEVALQQLGLSLDVNASQIDKLLRFLQANKQWLHLQGKTCADFMQTQPQYIDYGADLLSAWHSMRDKGCDRLIVCNKSGRVEGQLVLADLLALAGLAKDKPDFRALEQVLAPTGSLHANKPEAAGQLMQKIHCVGRKMLLTDLHQQNIDFAAVVDDDQILIGYVDISQPDE